MKHQEKTELQIKLHRERRGTWNRHDWWQKFSRFSAVTSNNMSPVWNRVWELVPSPFFLTYWDLHCVLSSSENVSARQVMEPRLIPLALIKVT